MYEYMLSREEDVEKERKDTVDGKEVVIKEKVKEQVPHKFYLLQPPRSLKDNAAVYYAAMVSKFVNEGINTKIQLRRWLIDSGGVLSNSEKAEMTATYEKLWEATSKYTRLTQIEEKRKTEEDKKNLVDLTKELLELQQKAQEFEQNQAELFNLCSESLAKNKLVLYNLVFLSYQDSLDKKTQIPFFGEGDLDKRLDRLEEVDNSDDAWLVKIKDEFLLYASIFTEGIARTAAEFKAVRERI